VATIRSWAPLVEVVTLLGCTTDLSVVAGLEVEAVHLMMIMALRARRESIPSRSRAIRHRYWTARPVHLIVDPRGYLQAALRLPQISRPSDVGP
jgi:hypothetical protein